MIYWAVLVAGVAGLGSGYLAEGCLVTDWMSYPSRLTLSGTSVVHLYEWLDSAAVIPRLRRPPHPRRSHLPHAVFDLAPSLLSSA
jgi:hypothetical protein